MFKLMDLNDTVVHQSQTKPEWILGIWECGDARFTDQDESLYYVVEIDSPLSVSPIHFKLLFTSQERIKAKELRATDSTIDDFWSILDDPRTQSVDMYLLSIQGAIEYTLAEINANGVTIDVAARKAQILQGIIQ